MKSYCFDLYRYYGRYKERFREKIFRPNGIKFIILYRKYNNTNSKIIKKYYKLRYKFLSKKTHIEIPFSVRIDSGFYIGHEGSVTVNPDVAIGKNVNIATGVTIGQENRGKRKGVPTIGNDVWIGTNSVIVGKIEIGNDVLIAPLTFINFDVPDHSIVIGNPGRIIKKANATQNYINRRI